MKGVKLLLFVLMVLGLASCIDNDDPNKQLNEEISRIDQYLQSNGKANSALYDNNSGIRFLINDYGQNPPAHNGQTVKLNYVGRLFPDETVFDSGVKNDKVENILPAFFPFIAKSILGGTTTRVFVPSKYGYGTQGSQALGVPANAILIYDIELEEVQRTAVEQSRYITDSTAIANYLEDNQLSATYLPSGVWYSVTEQGTGSSPNVYSTVTLDYELRRLADPGSVIESNTLTDTWIFGLIDGFKVALPFVNVGTKVTLYIPSGLAYGSNASATIPANSNLIFNITLKSIK